MTAETDVKGDNTTDSGPAKQTHDQQQTRQGHNGQRQRQQAPNVTLLDSPLDAPRRINIIDKVRAMLAKASSTTHEPEREAFEAKAQALITRYQIEARELDQADSEVIERQIKVTTWGDASRGVIYLYGGIAELNRSSAAHRAVGDYSQVILFGTEVDLDLTETVVGHLLPQLRTHMLLDQPTSRMSYAIGWTHEVLSRLIAAQRATAAEFNALVPTNTAADDAMLNSYKLKSDSQTTMVDSAEYEFGASAAGRADIGRTKLAAS